MAQWESSGATQPPAEGGPAVWLHLCRGRDRLQGPQGCAGCLQQLFPHPLPRSEGCGAPRHQQRSRLVAISILYHPVVKWITPLWLLIIKPPVLSIVVAGLGQVLEFIYTAKLNLSPQNLEDVLTVANFLQMQEIVNACSAYQSVASPSVSLIALDFAVGEVILRVASLSNFKHWFGRCVLTFWQISALKFLQGHLISSNYWTHQQTNQAKENRERNWRAIWQKWHLKQWRTLQKTKRPH